MMIKRDKVVLSRCSFTQHRTHAAERDRSAVRRWCVLLVAFIIGSQSANAAVVVESYVGPRPKDAPELLAPLLAELETLGVAARPRTVYARTRDRGRPPGVSNPAITLTTL